MTIGASNRNDYVGNGNVDTYAYNYKIFAATDLRVTVRDTNDVETTLTYPTHYTVSNVGRAAGGNVALVNGAFGWLDADGDLKSGYTLTIRRVRPVTQATDIRNQGGYYPETHEDAFDHLVMIDQQQQDEINRSFRLPESVPTTEADPTLPVPEDGTFLSWQTDSTTGVNRLINVDASDLVTIAASQNQVVDFFVSGADFTEGSTAVLTLSMIPGAEENIDVTFNGVVQHHNTFGVSGTTLTFSSAIPVGVTEVEVKYLRTLEVNTIASENATWTQAGSGSVTRSVRDKLREVAISVTDKGAVGNGVADDTAAIQAAIDYCESLGGGYVMLPPLEFLISAPLTITDAVTLDGGGIAVIKPNFATGDVISIDGSAISDPHGPKLLGIRIAPTVTRTNDYLVNLDSVNWAVIDNCDLLNGYRGIGVTGDATNGLRIRNTKILYSVDIGLHVTAATGAQGCVDGVVENVLISSASALTQPNNGILIASAGDLTLRHVSTIWSGNGLHVAPGNGQVVQSLNVVDSYFDSGDGYGILLSPSGTGAIRLTKLTDVWSASNDFSGLTINGANVKETSVLNCTLVNNDASGLELLAGSNTTIIGGAYAQNGANGINVAANVNKFKIIGANVGASGNFTGNTTYGIVINAGTSDEYTITNNYLSGNGSGQLSDGGTGTSKNVQGNIGDTNKLTNSLGADVDCNNTGNYFTGPTVAQGTGGTWFASGKVTVTDTSGAANVFVKLWDGTTVIDSAFVTVPAANSGVAVSLSGFITNPAGNIRISVRDTSSTSGKIKFNSTGESKDSTLSAVRISS